MPRIVVNYRSDDVPAEARRIHDVLAARLAPGDVALTDDPRRDRGAPAAGEALVVLIGPRWLELMRGHAARGERDAVRAEIAAALRRGTPVVPVRVGRADAVPLVPRAADLPDDIRALASLEPRIVLVDRIEADAAGLLAALRPMPVAVEAGRAPGNSSLKLALWSAAIIACTVLFANLLARIMEPVGPGRPQSTQAGGPARPSISLPAWTGEGRIRRAIEAALAKGRRPEEARRCQIELMAATDSGNILFNTASADLDQRSHQTLDTLAAIIKGCPDYMIEIEGHTDNVGEPANNQRLSERRANAVRDYLVRAGVPATVLSAVGFGDTRPVAANDTPANMARNRRIELNVSAR